MTLQGQPSSHSSRGQRFNLPSGIREARKVRQPRAVIQMCDGSYASIAAYHHLRSTAHQKFRGTHYGCAEKLRCAIPRTEWRKILAWIDDNRPKFGHATRQNDGLVAVAVGYAAQQSQRSVEDVFSEILRDGTARALLPSD